MAHNEADREDLLREAVALVRRMEIRLPGEQEPWVFGFRRNSAFSLFVGADPVFQFNTQLQLRRAFWLGRLVKAEGKSLHWLDRKRSDEATVLLRTELTRDESAALLKSAREHLDQLASAIEQASFECVGAVPDRESVIAAARSWLAEAPRHFEIADAPNVH